VYIPVEEEKLKKYETWTEEIFEQKDSLSNGAVPLLFLFGANKIKMCRCYIRFSPSIVIIENLCMHEVSGVFSTRIKEMFLTLAIRRLITLTKSGGKKELVIFTSNKLLPEIFINNGFKFRKTLPHEFGEYRGSFLLGDKFN